MSRLLSSCFLVRDIHTNFVIKPPSPPQRSVQGIGSVRGADDHNRFVIRLVPCEIIHTREKLCDDAAFHLSLCALSFWGYGIDLVDEQQARSKFLWL
jgi:hypothetical protein